MASLMNPSVLSAAEKVHEAFGKTSFNDEDLTVTAQPFSSVTIKKLIEDEEFITQLEESLKTIQYRQKHNDLYRFKQSLDLKTCDDLHVKRFYEFLSTCVRSWIQTVTGFELNSTIDIFAAIYEHGDRLLCHDDRLQTRKIAYIYYLTDDWLESDGGLLELLEADEHGQPRMCATQKIVPSRNTFALFEVSARSYHQVTEVLASSKKRVSLTGWFHADAPGLAQCASNGALNMITRLDFHGVYSPHLLVRHAPVDVDEEVFMSWLNVAYLNEKTQKRIRKRFEHTSEIELVDFLAPSKYQEVVQALGSFEDSACWKRIGPANRRNYFSLNLDQLSQLGPNTSAESSSSNSGKQSASSVLRQLCDLLKSEALFLTLGCLTGLNLHPLCESSPKNNEAPASNSNLSAQSNAAAAEPSTQPGSESNWRCVQEVRKWTPGCYTLLSDFDDEPSTDCACASDATNRVDDNTGNSASAKAGKKRKGEEKDKRKAKRRRGETALDVCFYIACPPRSATPKGGDKEDTDQSGATTYVARDDSEVLLSVNPKNNCLSIVYRDPETLKFVNYVRHKQAASGVFFDVFQAFYQDAGR